MVIEKDLLGDGKKRLAEMGRLFERTNVQQSRAAHKQKIGAARFGVSDFVAINENSYQATASARSRGLLSPVTRVQIPLGVPVTRVQIPLGVFDPQVSVVLCDRWNLWISFLRPCFIVSDFAECAVTQRAG